MRSPERPGGALPQWQLFEQKVHLVDGKQKVVGFNAPDGKYCLLAEGEELVHIKSESGSGRNTFIRKNEQDIPFDEWKEGK